MIHDYKEIHTEIIDVTIYDLDDELINEPAFDFRTAVNNPAEFTVLGAMLEDTDIVADAKASTMIENDDFILPALGFHSSKARYASFLRVLNGDE